jgi:hypothetical protein
MIVKAFYRGGLSCHCLWPVPFSQEPVFINLSRSRGIYSKPGVPIRQPYLLFLPARARICKRLRRPGIASKESIPPAYVGWRAGTSNRVVVPALQTGTRFLGSLKGLQIRAGYLGWRNRFLENDSWAPETFTNTGSANAGCCQDQYERDFFCIDLDVWPVWRVRLHYELADSKLSGGSLPPFHASCPPGTTRTRSVSWDFPFFFKSE